MNAVIFLITIIVICILVGFIIVFRQYRYIKDIIKILPKKEQNMHLWDVKFWKLTYVFSKEQASHEREKITREYKKFMIFIIITFVILAIALGFAVYFWSMDFFQRKLVSGII